jgi:acid phosphatase type 7
MPILHNKPVCFFYALKTYLSMEYHFNIERPAEGQVTEAALFGTGAFQPLPPPTGKAPFHLDIKNIISQSDYDTISQNKRMLFHTTGDVGGIKTPQDQTLVTDHMEMQFDKNNSKNNPAFLYIIGDLVYYYGQLKEYNNQFYEPYKFYPAPIFAIPGNHDGDIDPTDTPKPASLEAFVKLFCSPKPVIPPEAGDSVRTTMTQPNVYWTLVTPVANIIGLYTNVPEGGIVKDDQRKWFVKELIAANKERTNKALIVALHHPPYSMDAHHGASVKMQTFLNAAFTEANVQPDIVLTGHVHNYQRFTKKEGTRDVAYIVAGAGGYWHLHNINTKGSSINTPCPSSFPGVTFEKYSEDRHGFLTIDVDMSKSTITGKYYTVPRLQESWKAAPKLFDTFTIDLVKGKVSSKK